MLRRTLAIVAVGVGLASLSAAGGEKGATLPADDIITFTAVKTKGGPAIRVSAGDTVFVVPRLAFESSDGTPGNEITVEDGKLSITIHGSPSSELIGSATCPSLSMSLRRIRTNRAVSN
jgi:hypothetical protein